MNIPQLRFEGFEGEWESTFLKNEVDFFDNKRKPITENLRKKGIYPYYGATGIIDYVEDYVLDGEYLLLAEDGANILTRSAPVVYKTKNKFWVNNHAHVLKPKEFNDFNFFYQVLENINYTPYNSGTAQPKLNLENVKKVPLTIPSYDEQKKIGYFFALLNQKIKKQQEKIENLEQFKKGMMQKTFSQELRFKDEDGREFPEWKNKELGQMAEIIMGQSPKGENYSTDNQNAVLIQGNADMKNGKVVPRIYTSEITKACLPGDIIMSVRAPVGEIALTDIEACIGRGVCAIRGNMFIYHYLSYFNLIKAWNSLSQGSTFESVNGNDIKTLTIPAPSIKEQEKIADYLTKLEKKVEKEKEKLMVLEEQKKGFMQGMFV